MKKKKRPRKYVEEYVCRSGMLCVSSPEVLLTCLHPSIALQVNPLPSRILGVFGLSVHTSESHVRQIFSKFGPIDRLKVVYDSKTGRSRGFCFVYYQNTEDARAAKDQCSGMEIDRQRIRVDFSMTARAHSPTPGVYMGKPTRDHTDREQRERDRGEGDRDYNHHQNYSNSTSSAPNYRRRRSPSPQYRRRRNRSVSYSPRTRKAFVFSSFTRSFCPFLSELLLKVPQNVIVLNYASSNRMG